MTLSNAVPGRFAVLNNSTPGRVAVLTTNTALVLDPTTRRVQIVHLSGGDTYFQIGSVATVAASFPVVASVINEYFIAQEDDAVDRTLNFIADTTASALAVLEFAA